MPGNEYLTANGCARIILKHLGLDIDDTVYQWQVAGDGVFDGIMIRTRDAEAIRRIDATWKELVDPAPSSQKEKPCDN